MKPENAVSYVRTKLNLAVDWSLSLRDSTCDSNQSHSSHVPTLCRAQGHPVKTGMNYLANK